MSQSILNQVSNYYTSKVEQFGATSKGVDWNGEESQYQRFQQLSNVISEPNSTVLDYGCGYGEYINFLRNLNIDCTYYGVDISPKMIEVAKGKFKKLKENFKTSTEDLPKIDYSIASGLFNVRNTIPDSDWILYIKKELIKLNNISTKGFAFNALTSYSDKEYMKDYLYYANPLELFDFCKKNFSRNVALLHDYELYEFTIIVRK